MPGAMRRAVGLLRRAPEVACPGSWPAASQLQSARFATGDESEASSSVTASQSGAGAEALAELVGLLLWSTGWLHMVR